MIGSSSAWPGTSRSAAAAPLPALADLAVAVLDPIRERLIRLMDDRAAVAATLEDGAERARALAAPTLLAAQRAVGLQI